MDQVFSLLKTLMEQSRQALFKNRAQVDGPNAQTTVWDVPSVLFGGEMLLKNGTTVDLPNNFSEGLAPERFERACLKCGYIPATRIALKSEKLHHELFLNSDGEVDHDADPLGMILKQLEQHNHQVEEELAERGFLIAKNIKRSINVISGTRRAARSTKTLPNTRERQEALMGILTAGAWFKITNGGVPMNCNNAIIALELERLLDIGKKTRGKEERGNKEEGTNRSRRRNLDDKRIKLQRLEQRPLEENDSV
jgi:hypothetical protein